jgi:pseudouridine synthase, rluA family
MEKEKKIELEDYLIIDIPIGIEKENVRIDKYIVGLENLNISREKIKKGILSESILLNLKKTKNSNILKNNDKIYILKDIVRDIGEIRAENIEIKNNILKNEMKNGNNILEKIRIYEDEDILVINKPKGMIVHKGNGNFKEITLSDVLEFNYNDLPGEEGRKGIVHRLDKDTTGLIVVAKTKESMNNLILDFKERNIIKKYVCIVRGEIKEESFTIKLPIARDLKNRHKMCISKDGKEAITKVKKIWAKNGITKLEIELLTGRTHQIRVHMAYLGYPIIGDNIYSNRKK